MRVKTHAMATFMLALAPALCAAENALATVGELSAVQSDTIMFEAKAKRAEAQLRMLENSAKAGSDPSAPGPFTSAVTPTEVPTVEGISGAQGRLYATFRYPNGTSANGKSGDSIPGEFKVAEVGIDRAVVTKNGRRFVLQFGVARPEPSEQAEAQPLRPVPGPYVPR